MLCSPSISVCNPKSWSKRVWPLKWGPNRSADKDMKGFTHSEMGIVVLFYVLLFVRFVVLSIFRIGDPKHILFEFWQLAEKLQHELIRLGSDPLKGARTSCLSSQHQCNFTVRLWIESINQQLLRLEISRPSLFSSLFTFDRSRLIRRFLQIRPDWGKKLPHVVYNSNLHMIRRHSATSHLILWIPKNLRC